MGIDPFRSEQLLAYGYHHTLVLSALSSEGMALALPILCALPYTAAFLDDVKSGFIKAYLPRTTVDGYIMSRALGCAISGGLAISLGILAAYGIAALLLLPLEAMRDYMLEPPGYFRQLMPPEIIWKELFVAHRSEDEVKRFLLRRNSGPLCVLRQRSLR